MQVPQFWLVIEQNLNKLSVCKLHDPFTIDNFTNSSLLWVAVLKLTFYRPWSTRTWWAYLPPLPWPMDTGVGATPAPVRAGVPVSNMRVSPATSIRPPSTPMGSWWVYPLSPHISPSNTTTCPTWGHTDTITSRPGRPLRPNTIVIIEVRRCNTTGAAAGWADTPQTTRSSSMAIRKLTSDYFL